MPWTIALVFAYGIVTIVLGIVGFVHGHSLPSIISGSISGALVILGGVLAKQHPKVGFGIVAFVAVATLGRFGMAFAKSRDIYPAGVIALTAIIGLIAAIGGFMGAGRP